MWMVVIANSKYPSITAQNIGRELYHGREEMVQIIGNKHTLKAIAWIFAKVPDMFEIQFKSASLIVSRTKEQSQVEVPRAKEAETTMATQTPELLPIAH